MGTKSDRGTKGDDNSTLCDFVQGRLQKAMTVLYFAQFRSGALLEALGSPSRKVGGHILSCT